MTKSKLKQNWSAFWENYRRNDSLRLSLIVSMMVLLLFVTNAAGDLEPLTNVDYSIVSKASKIILFLLLVCNVKAVLRRMTGEKILGLLFVALLFLVSFCVTGDRALLRSMFLHYCLTVLPIIVVISCIDDYKFLLDSLIRVSRVIAVCAVALLISRKRVWLDYSMGLANSLTLPAVMLLYGAYRSKNILDLLLAGTTTVVIFVLGSRGALLGIMVYFLMLLVMGCSRKDRRRISILCIALICLALVFWRPILTWIEAVLEKAGSSSRTIQLLLSGEIFLDNGRESIYIGMKDEIMLHPFVIHGIGGELPFAEGLYAHNFAIELMLDFGVILGGIATLYILYQSGRTLGEVVRREDAFRMIRLIFFSVSVPLAMISGTIWSEVYLWCWLVLCDKRYPSLVKRAAKVADEGKLLSIVVPTEGRYVHLFSLIEQCASLSGKDFELVIQDSSNDNREWLAFLSKSGYEFVAYHHDASLSSPVQNSESALQHACGRYVCFLEEDDLLSEKLVDFVAYMEQKDLDSAIFNIGRYCWPGSAQKALRQPNLILRSFDGQIRRINAKRAYRRFLRTGAVCSERMPQLFRGVVRRTVLDQVREACGAYFPGPDLDLALSAAMAPFVKRHVFFNVPLICAGATKASGGEREAKAVQIHCQIGALACKAWRQVSDKLLMTIRLGGVLLDGLPDTVAAQKRIDEEIGRIPLPF